MPDTVPFAPSPPLTHTHVRTHTHTHTHTELTNTHTLVLLKSEKKEKKTHPGNECTPLYHILSTVQLSTFLIPLHLFTWTCWGYSNVWGSAWIGCTGFCIVTAVPQLFPCGSVGLLNPSQASVTVQCGAHVS